MRIALFLIGFFTLFSITDVLSQKKEVTVVIDAGHGGHDPGHLSINKNLLPEKDLNLKISTYLGGYIQKYLKNVKVIYTRTSDTYPSLDARVNAANNNNADYFISIHCNGNDRKSVRGTETHVHSMHLKKSVSLAKAIEKQFSARAGRKSRGVKDEKDLQHSLQVLKYTNMTSVLVECGFVTNAKEAQFLNTSYGQEIIASAIFRGFRGTIEGAFPNIAFRKEAPSNSTAPVAEAHDKSTYGIQIASSKLPIDTKSDPGFKRIGMAVDREKLNTTSAYKYIYLVGNYASRKEARQALEGIRNKGFKDALVVKR